MEKEENGREGTEKIRREKNEEKDGEKKEKGRVQ